MKKIFIGLILGALLSTSGCYFGAQNMGEVGVYYATPHSRVFKRHPEWIPAHRMDYYSHPQNYVYWH